MRTVVATFSMTGTTDAAGVHLAAALGGTHERIAPSRGRMPHKAGFWLVWTLIGMFFGRVRASRPPVTDLADVDLLIVGSPVWAGQLPPLTRGYLRHVAGSGPKRWAGFVTLGGAGADTALGDMERRIGVAPVATCALTDADRQGGADTGKLDAFVAELRASSPASA